MATITVPAAVAAREKRRQGIGVRRVQFDTVIAGFPRAQRSQAKIMNDALNVSDFQRLNGLPPAGARDFHKMNNLRHDLGSGGVVHPLGQFPMAGDENVVGQAQQWPGFCTMDRGCFHHDQADTASGITYITVNDVNLNHAILTR